MDNPNSYKLNVIPSVSELDKITKANETTTARGRRRPERALTDAQPTRGASETRNHEKLRGNKEVGGRGETANRSFNMARTRG